MYIPFHNIYNMQVPEIYHMNNSEQEWRKHFYISFLNIYNKQVLKFTKGHFIKSMSSDDLEMSNDRTTPVFF